ncbi:PREDICTED: F-box only protein 39-like [Vollenhovia emeryi]|uniref:F-box only protein 39-like n=1 Tax=Vollenhovia emeryi TaxID=411798 RepID=UPI0005F53DAA|nr:PREDICTED: F-box only protein 39-like [Vollenhovia emeryi]
MWDQLPELILTQIFGHLDRADRASVSQVCRSWNRSLSSPVLWRSVTVLIDRDLRGDFPLAGELAAKYGQHMRSLELAFSRPYISPRQIRIRYNTQAEAGADFLALGINHVMVHRVLKSELLYPFHRTKVQELNARDHHARVNFCRWLLQNNEADENFLANIMWTDESLFTRTGLFNCHNEHYYDVINPRVTRTRSFQHRWKLNFWAGILGDRVIGPTLSCNILVEFVCIYVYCFAIIFSLLSSRI